MKNITRVAILLALFGAFFAACSPAGTRQATSTPALAQTGATAVSAAASPSAAPTPTTQASKVLLVSPADAGAQAVQAALTELGKPSGLSVELRPALQKADLTPDIKVAVLLSAPADLADLVSAAPQVQFITVAAADLPAAPNLTVIRTRLENQAFIAGFISVLLSTDFRAAALLPTDGPLGATLKDAFVNGSHYFCGVCAPGWPLKVYYPQVVEQPSASDGPTWQAAAAAPFDSAKVEVYYVSAEAARPEVIAFLQGKTQLDKPVLLVGNLPPPEELKSQWAATVGFDLPALLRQIWPDVQAGKGGTTVDAPLLVDNVNADFLGSGRMRLVNNLIDEIKAGRVYPLTIPLQ